MRTCAAATNDLTCFIANERLPPDSPATRPLSLVTCFIYYAAVLYLTLYDIDSSRRQSTVETKSHIYTIYMMIHHNIVVIQMQIPVGYI